MAKVTHNPELTVDVDLFRQKLRLMREFYGLSRPKFALELGNMPPTSLKNYELGYRTTPLEVLMAINSSRFAHHIPWLLNRTAPVDSAGLSAQPQG